MSETKPQTKVYYTREAVLLAVEYGFQMHERGFNLQATLQKATTMLVKSEETK